MDVNELIHSAVYDAAKRRERYLRSRQLKGRAKGSGPSAIGGTSTGAVGTNVGMRSSRQTELKAQREALEERLDVLKEVLRKKVEAAKKRSGGDTSEAPTGAESSTASKSKGSKSSKSETSSEPLTEKQKADKRKASAEQYEKEKRMGLTQEVQQLQEQIKDIRARIAKAVEEAPKPKKYSTNLQTVSKDR